MSASSMVIMNFLSPVTVSNLHSPSKQALCQGGGAGGRIGVVACFGGINGVATGNLTSWASLINEEDFIFHPASHIPCQACGPCCGSSFLGDRCKDPLLSQQRLPCPISMQTWSLGFTDCSPPCGHLATKILSHTCHPGLSSSWEGAESPGRLTSPPGPAGAELV